MPVWLVTGATGFLGRHVLAALGEERASDLAITTLDDVLTDVRRITAASDLPLLVDADTGWGGAFLIARTVREMTRAGAAGIHLEDQVQAKRCGHRPGKALVGPDEMADRVKAAVDGREDDSFVLMARKDGPRTLSRIGPRFSWNVKISARIWQGCSSPVSALIVGMPA